jgi:excisionase family DNA binding protein
MSKVLPISPEAAPEKNGDDMIVTLRVSQLRALIREELAAVNGNGHGRLLTAEELAVKLQVHPATIYEKVKAKKIPFYQVGRFVRFSLQEVLESQRKNENPS